VGDFNFTPRHPLYRHLRLLGLRDAFGVAGQGRGPTLPVHIGPASWVSERLHWVPLRPVVRIDFIWYTAPMVAQAAWVGPDGGSDHLPVLARVHLASRS
jgi:endonuclease/exonuclease/phosphatase (EEP) superfamily protein YafD